MRFKWVLLILIFVLVLMPPLNIYAKWHLKTFSGGFIYTLLNLTYVPDDYYKQVGGIWVDTDKSRSANIHLEHRYRGKYGVYVIGETVQNKNHNVSAIMNCADKIIELESGSSKITDLNRKTATSLLIGMYDVESDFPHEVICSISIDKKTKGQFFIFVRKFRHY
ncbi:MAG: hypothetical protein HRU18_07720 [Pseudoalteromonas sp.]|uniref:hypothetical protein n=1 Tax=Pseudoalteromonas sp. TaxID=53249 RepID=UPI001D7E76CF|nr:hypothetical protein [Pseudoalteromonas sp.]NRA78080.1 hypothetical protein [Pseudoalteromonas sp.]